ncbi:unnamed protein product [Caenorhabditis angaria]|uniref:Uncharacterized protein n=1 Tax=Caenorhabditis angaria TaxID=860376 RepID=A0A9P1N1S0_9PELO|nr:unnamed protein product [Caenorhabditis angaria]
MTKPVKKTKFSLQQLDSIPGQIGYIVCEGNKIVHTTIKEDENPTQIAFNALRLASRTKSPEFADHPTHTIQVQFDHHLFELFQIAQYFIIVKKRVEDPDE